MNKLPNLLTKSKNIFLFLLLVIGSIMYPNSAYLQDRVPTPDKTKPFISGTPFLQNWSYEEYGGHTQNWAIVQDHRGVMYIGNGEGVLEFDGVNWRLIKFPNESMANSLAIDEKGQVFVGAENEFGYLLPDSQGQLKYVSLMEYVPEQYTDFAYVWKTIVTSQGVYFMSNRYVFHWDNSEENQQESLQIIPSKTSFRGAFLVNDNIYIGQGKAGIYKIEGNSLHAIQDGEFPEVEGIYSILQYTDENLLVCTRERGMFLFDGNSLKRFKTSVDEYILKNYPIEAVALSDGTIAIGTKTGGIIIIDRKGNLRMVVDEAAGLNNNQIRSLYAGREGGLWLALNNGISRVEVPSPFTRFGANFGIKGYIEDIVWHDEKMYVATSKGVYFLPLNSSSDKNPDFQRVAGIPFEAWSLLAMGTKLLVATGNGVYQIEKNGKTTLIYNANSGLLYASKKYPGLVYFSLSEGMAILQLSNGQWHSSGQLKETIGSVRTIIEDKEGSVWLGTAQNGVQRIKFREPFTGVAIDKSIPVYEIDYYDEKDGIVPEDVDIFSYRDQIHFAASQGLWRFDSRTNKFELDLSLGKVMADTGHWIGRTVEDDKGRLWLERGGEKERNVGVLIPQGDGTFKWDFAPFEKISKEDIWLIYPDPIFKGSVWFGGEQGLLKYDPAISNNNSKEYPVLIRRIMVHHKKTGVDSVIFGGTSSKDRGNLISIPEIRYIGNSMRFEYAAVSYSDPDAIQYQVMLEGFDESWSARTHEVKKDYTNLPEGTYKFKVKAINLYKTPSIEASFSFRILPPWWRTWWAYAIYGILALALLKMADIVLRKRIIEREQLNAREKEWAQTKEIEKSYKELKATQSQLVQSEKMASLGELTAGIAHEIQNPLNFVNNFSEVSVDLIKEMNEEIENGNVEDAKAIGEDLKENLEKISNHGKRASSIVKGMLEHSRAGEGKKEPTDINAIADEYIRLAYHGLRAKDKSFNADFKTDLDEKIPKINIVGQDIARVILNLINNAFFAVSEASAKETAVSSEASTHRLRQASGERRSEDGTYKPIVTISTKKTDQGVEIRVTDNGEGIPSDIVDKIFQPFFTTKASGEGTGLGLSISYDIITKGHGGELKVKTEKNKGTEFIIQLPIDG